MFQIFEIGDNNMKVEFLSYSGLIVSALLCFFNKEVQVDFVRNACGLPFAIAIIVNILYSRFIASGCLESEMAAVLLTPAYGEFNF